jgi:murein DD-endopeptidase MepM/ murein hydrolase activator NlpD
MNLKMNHSTKLIFTTLLFFSFALAGLLSSQEIFSLSNEDIIEWYVPINTENRQSLENVQLSSIGLFGLARQARPSIPAHLHTGIDFKRPNPNYIDEPVFPAAKGTVISLRDDGPYAQIIIQHSLENSTSIWTVYEHIAGIRTKLNESVDPHHPIARFMTRNELNKYGWQFDHIHFEVMRVKPIPRQPDKTKPSLYYGTYGLVCYTQTDLDERYYHPLDYLKQKWDDTL